MCLERWKKKKTRNLRLIEYQGDSVRIRYLKMTLRRRQIPIASLARIRGCRECFRAGLSRRKADLYFRINPSDLEKWIPKSEHLVKPLKSYRKSRVLIRVDRRLPAVCFKCRTHFYDKTILPNVICAFPSSVYLAHCWPFEASQS